MSMHEFVLRNWRRYAVALVLAAALLAGPVALESVPEPLDYLFAELAYACPVGGECG